MLMSEEAYAVPGLRAALGRLANSVVAVLGPELSPGTDVYTKCKALIREVQVGLHNIKLLSRQSMLACCTFQVLNMTTSAVMLSSSQSQNVPVFTECPSCSGYHTQKSLGDSKNVFLHWGDVLNGAAWQRATCQTSTSIQYYADAF